MRQNNYYDVTTWTVGDPYDDIGEVINSMISDIKSRQKGPGLNEEGKPGAVIFIPPGDYHLRTQVLIDISYLKIQGCGHGFISSSIRFNTPPEEWQAMHDLWPGGSRILVNLPSAPSNDEAAGAAFYVKREGSPRISSVEFCNFCIDGLHFMDDSDQCDDPENTYVNGRTGIYIASKHDSFRITEMGFVYLEHALTAYYADALTIHDNFIAECGNCVELRGYGQASKITDNLMGAGYKGYTIFAENFGGLLIASNNIFPRGKSSVHLSRVMRSSVTANRFHSFYPGMIILDENCTEDLVASNHLLRDHEPWPPMLQYDNGLDDTFGLIRISGNDNSVFTNHISETIGREYLKPKGVRPVIIRIASGRGNHVIGNHIAAKTETLQKTSAEDDSCFDTQVEALLSIDRLVKLDVTAVCVDESAVGNYVLDTGTEDQIIMDRTRNVLRALPDLEA